MWWQFKSLWLLSTRSLSCKVLMMQGKGLLG